MRIIIYAIFNKETNERVYSNCRQSKCQEVLDTMVDKENYEIRYKWRSF